MSPDFTLETDASILGLGARFSQITNYTSNYICKPSTTPVRSDTELQNRRHSLAVVWAISHFHHYLHWNKVTVLTDHTVVKAVLEAANPSAKHARWWTKVYGRGVRSVNIKYRAGREKENTDALWRWPHLSAPEVGIAEDEVQVSTIATKKGEVTTMPNSS